MLLQALIIDDEERAINLLKKNIEKNIPEITTLHTALSAKEGLDCIEKHRPALVFLDVEMPNMNGFEMLNQIANPNFDVIFTTAFNQYAIKAIKYSALDYLLKPIDADDLRKAFDHFVQHSKNNLTKAALYASLISNLELQDEQHFKLTLCSNDSSITVEVKDIIRCESESNYTTFHFAKHKKWVSAKTLKEYDEILSNRGFIRVHKSHLVNKNYIERLSEHHVILQDQTEVELARRRRQLVIDTLGLS